MIKNYAHIRKLNPHRKKNYEHDKTVLAKEDPMFAKNKFWDTGHAEGSGEISNKEREKIKNEKLQSKIEKLMGELDG